MPNWCHNTLTVKGDEECIHTWVERAASFVSTEDPQEQPLWLEAFYPVPADEEYNWRDVHWGTKWEASFSAPLLPSAQDNRVAFRRKEGQATYKFDTAWAPPIPWLEKVSRDYPKLHFYLLYGEIGDDYGGRALLVAGQFLGFEEGAAKEYLQEGEMWF